jgi:hypothetical protein
MAKMKNSSAFAAPLEGYSVVNNGDGSLYLRRRSRISKERIATDPNFKRVRENLQEFGTMAKATKLIRTTFADLKDRIQFRSLNARLSSVVSKLKYMDNVSMRGERKVSSGIATDEGKAILNGFSFSELSTISSVMTKTYELNEDTKALTIAGLITNDNLSWTPGADVVGIKLLWANIDFDNNEFAVVESNEVKSAKSQVPLNINLAFANPPAGSGVNVIVMVITYYQSVNGMDYIFMNGSYNVAQIISVS